MDSRIIYESAKTYIQNIAWVKPKNSTDSEWVYIDTQNNIDNIIKIIQNFLISDQLYVAINRQESFEIDKKLTLNNIKSYIGTVDFSIWDFQFNKVIEFNKIGIYRIGIKSN